ncbi:MAG: hypothetical protein MUQ65_04290, partial [Armatimonadetes bacterium]|nr:hypothetical protein [Armatimonadota bacterium]
RKGVGIVSNLNVLGGFVDQATSSVLVVILLSRFVVRELSELAIFVCDEWRRVSKHVGGPRRRPRTPSTNGDP